MDPNASQTKSNLQSKLERIEELRAARVAKQPKVRAREGALLSPAHSSPTHREETAATAGPSATSGVPASSDHSKSGVTVADAEEAAPVGEEDVQVSPVLPPVVPRNGYDLLSAWDSMASGRGGEANPVVTPSVIASFTAAHLLLPGAGMSLPTVVDLDVAELPLTIAGTMNRGTEGKVVVVAAALSTFLRDYKSWEDQSGEDVELQRRLGAARDKGFSAASWGGRKSGEPSATSFGRSADRAMLFGSESDHFLMKHSSGLVLVWAVVPVVMAEHAAASDGSATGASSSRQQISDVVVVIPLVCDVPVNSIIIHPFHPGVVIGGTSTGRVVSWNFYAAWDRLSTTQLRSRCEASTGTPNTLLLHCHPPAASSFPTVQHGIHRLSISGRPSAHHLHAFHTNGRVTSWVLRDGSVEPLDPRGSGAVMEKQLQFLFGTAASFTNKLGTDGTPPQVIVGTYEGRVLTGSVRNVETIDYVERWCGSTSVAAIARQIPEEKVINARETPLLVCLINGSLFLLPAGTKSGTPAVLLTESGVTTVCWSPVHRHLFATGSSTGEVWLWGKEPPMVLTALTPGRPHEAGSYCSSAITSLHYTSSSGSTLEASENNGGRTCVGDGVTSLCFSACGRWLFAGSSAGRVYAVILRDEWLTEIASPF